MVGRERSGDRRRRARESGMHEPNAAEIRLIRESWAKVVPASDVAARLFYGRLFALEPATRPLFRGDLAGQGAKLVATLDTLVASLEGLAAIRPHAEALAVRHVGYGVAARHYDVVGEALLWMLDRMLGPDFTPETRAAWAALYATLARTMLAAAAGAEAADAARRAPGPR